ncbi:ACP S-malonyltransferase [Pseudodesulfovibrio indicus]|uniref:Malonyl CoA-acyl carrier protein transacylase n=1 Tax=Pseudodesulfovibrio indicus TaxID=1716143 RepID=A0A140D9B8_9BACT|nr:ACP S-malonyltransferase [Pseudodesulfovibrio indicus]AMK09785.1 malonyl CoA-ACP transacylase [Pseudodesulfovibrio indicus]TDT86253.1 [acyl-carrier-protein] S-malonyltransferase [Pseudodesulfovibrio indicus]
MTKTGILFPGQGSQEKGMGRDVAEADSAALDLWKLAERESGLPLREIYWDGEESDMADTRALQPALTVVNLTLWMAVRDKLAPAATAGHSLGEFASLGAAGVLDVEDCVRAVILRGRLMAESGGAGHGMAAVVKLPQDKVEEIVAEAVKLSGAELRIANYNTPAQFVISGEKEALDAAEPLVKEARGRAIRLAVSGAFHSPLIKEAADEFAAFLEGLAWREPAFPVFHNATALPEPDPDAILTVMQRQMTSSVLWVQTVQAMRALGVNDFVEVGPKGVLTKMLKPNLAPDEDWTARAVGSLAQAGEL